LDKTGSAVVLAFSLKGKNNMDTQYPSITLVVLAFSLKGKNNHRIGE